VCLPWMFYRRRQQDETCRNRGLIIAQETDHASIQLRTSTSCTQPSILSIKAISKCQSLANASCKGFHAPNDESEYPYSYIYARYMLGRPTYFVHIHVGTRRGGMGDGPVGISDPEPILTLSIPPVLETDRGSQVKRSL
jgi:hypothetical protein